MFWIKKIKGEYKFINNNLVLRGVDKFLPKYVDNYFYVGKDEKEFASNGGLDIYGKFPSNSETMLHYGFLRIYDSGYKTWLLDCNNVNNLNEEGKIG